MERMGNPAPAPEGHFSYRHYKTWPDEERWELIDGHAWAMSPAPMRQHQAGVRYLTEKFSAFLRGKPCEVYPTPFDVLLPSRGEADDEVDTVVQPDLVVEILSPSTQKKDLNEKFRLYERHGVREYWAVDPGKKTIQVRHLRSAGGYDEGELRDPLREYGAISSLALEGFSVDPAELFADMD